MILNVRSLQYLMTATNTRQTLSYSLLFRNTGVISMLNKFMNQRPIFKCRTLNLKNTLKDAYEGG